MLRNTGSCCCARSLADASQLSMIGVFRRRSRHRFLSAVDCDATTSFCTAIRSSVNDIQTTTGTPSIKKLETCSKLNIRFPLMLFLGEAPGLTMMMRIAFLHNEMANNELLYFDTSLLVDVKIGESALSKRITFEERRHA